MEIMHNPLNKNVYFKLSGRSTGGTDKIGHLIAAIHTYRLHHKTKGYVSISIHLEDGLISPVAAKGIILGYKRAAQLLEGMVRMQGGNLDIDLGFVRL